MKKIFKTPLRLRRFSPPLLLCALLVTLLFVALVVVEIDRYETKKNVPITDGESLIVRHVSAADHVMGDISAPIQLIVYADLSCPYCKAFFSDTLPKLKRTYGDGIVVAYRHLPLSIHPQSHAEAAAAECVGQLGGNDAFWRFVKAVYAEPAYEKGLKVPELASVADGIGVSGTKVSSCVRSGVRDARVNADALEASVAGISQTPSVVLKSATRALIVKGNFYSQLDTGIVYLLQSGI